MVKADWETVNSPVNFDINTVSFIYNQNTGYIGCLAGNIYKTTNGGTNWTFVDLGNSGIRSIIFFDLLHGLAASYGTQMFITSNGGSNWSTVNTG